MPAAKPTKKPSASTLPAGNVRTTILMPASVHELGKTQAKAQRRSFSSWLTILIEKAEAAAAPEVAQ